ncbi:MAG: molybdenum cofactor guanylyltransferase [Sulfuricella sp.]|nr:molybdenum cofactor guanylyltransferase [Sulfuricella sp.]
MTSPAVTAIILAGGRGQRMGEADKGLQLLRGKPLVGWVADSIAPQAEEVLISANRNLERYRELGFAVLPDSMPDFPGPLAGLQRALESAKHPLWLSVPCDTPFLPPDLVERLRAALLSGDAELAVAAAGGRLQRVICLGYGHLRTSLDEFIARGGRRVGEWQDGLRLMAVPFEDELIFSNINTPEDLAAAEKRLNF